MILYKYESCLEDRFRIKLDLNSYQPLKALCSISHKLYDFSENTHDNAFCWRDSGNLLFSTIRDLKQMQNISNLSDFYSWLKTLRWKNLKGYLAFYLILPVSCKAGNRIRSPEHQFNSLALWTVETPSKHLH